MVHPHMVPVAVVKISSLPAVTMVFGSFSFLESLMLRYNNPLVIY